MANFKIECWRVCSTGTACLCDGFPCYNPVPRAGEQAAAVAIECHVAIAMINNCYQAKAPEPVGKNNPAIMNGFDLGFFPGLNDQPVPAQFAICVFFSKTTDYLALCRPWKLVAQRREGLGFIGRRDAGDGLLNLGKQLLQSLSIGLD